MKCEVYIYINNFSKRKKGKNRTDPECPLQPQPKRAKKEPTPNCPPQKKAKTEPTPNVPKIILCQISYLLHLLILAKYNLYYLIFHLLLHNKHLHQDVSLLTSLHLLVLQLCIKILFFTPSSLSIDIASTAEPPVASIGSNNIAVLLAMSFGTL